MQEAEAARAAAACAEEPLAISQTARGRGECTASKHSARGEGMSGWSILITAPVLVHSLLPVEGFSRLLLAKGCPLRAPLLPGSPRADWQLSGSCCSRHGKRRRRRGARRLLGIKWLAGEEGGSVWMLNAVKICRPLCSVVDGMGEKDRAAAREAGACRGVGRAQLPACSCPGTRLGRRGCPAAKALLSRAEQRRLTGRGTGAPRHAEQAATSGAVPSLRGLPDGHAQLLLKHWLAAWGDSGRRGGGG